MSRRHRAAMNHHNKLYRNLPLVTSILYSVSLMPGIAKVRINDRAAARLRGGHVWVYASDVVEEGGAGPGALVHVAGPKDKPLGTAIYSSASQIKLRLLTRELLGS